MQGSKKVLVKLGQFDRASAVFRSLVGEKLPFKASYWLRRDIDIIGRVYQPFLDSKAILFKEFAELNEEGNVKLDETGTNVKLLENKKEEFWKQYIELANKEVEIEVYPLKLEWFDIATNCPHCKKSIEEKRVAISVEDLVAIDFLLEEDEDA
ncbi:MAG: hypothetical protein QMD92_00215 [bacterium]|nr:hypothetical protein [bacterium]